MKWNARLYWWLREKIFRVPEGVMAPPGLAVFRWLLMPVQSLGYRFVKDLYDMERDVYKIHGREYSGAIFRAWGRDGWPDGEVFRFRRGEGDIISLERLEVNR